MLLLLLTLVQQDSGFARAESLLAARNYPAAVATAERLVERSPNDPATHLLLGRIQYARPVVGRYPALEQFRLAQRLAPRDTAPLLWQVRVGQYLKSDEGERLVREAALKLFLLVPRDPEVWALFQSLSKNETLWHRADAALAAAGDDPLTLSHRGDIALALGEDLRADSLAGLVLARHPRDLASFLQRTEANFGAGRDAAGYAWYDSAMIYADLDSTDLLWSEVWLIAAPDEAARYRETPPGQRREFFEWFWGKRDPNLVTPQNERIAEHFRRIAYVRRNFHIEHPYATYHWSAERRTLVALSERDYVQNLATTTQPIPCGLNQECPTEPQPGPYSSTSTARLRAALGAAPDIRSVNDSVGNRSLGSLAGLDARGLLWIRHGKPDLLWQGVLDTRRPVDHGGQPGFWLIDNEGWQYDTPDGILTIGLHLAEGVGDFVMLPTDTRQVASARILMSTDRTTLPATLKARGWSAYFAGDAPRSTDLYVRTVPESAAAVLWDTLNENEVARAAGSGLLHLAAPPGPYRLGLDIDSGGAVGRIRERVRLPDFSPAVLGVSSLVIAAGDAFLDRAQTLARMPGDLTFPADHALATYEEVYGLSAGPGGVVRYLVQYRFNGPGPAVRFEFTREAPARPAVREQLVVAPERLRAGRYTVVVAVTDLHTNVKVVTRELKITLR